MTLFRILFSISFIIFIESIKAQPGFESKPIYLWILDNEDINKRGCNKKFTATAEFFNESEVFSDSKKMIVDKLYCKSDTIKHIYYDHHKKTQHDSYIEAIPAFFHPGRNAKDEYLVRSVTIIRSDHKKMKLNTGLYILKDDIYYSHGNGVSIPTVIYFKEGEYAIEDAQQFDETKRIVEKYKHSTLKYHQLISEQIRVEVPPIPQLRDDQLSINSGFIAVRVGSSFQIPVGNAIVKAFFEDETIRDFRYEKDEKNFSNYLYEEDPMSAYAVNKIKKITVSADNYIPEEFVPYRTIKEVTLFLRDEGYIYHSGFEKIPLHTDNRYLSVVFPDDTKYDTTGFSIKLKELGLIVDTTFNFCNSVFQTEMIDVMLLKKQDGRMFDDATCQELGFLRTSFKDIYISPKIFNRVAGDNGNQKLFILPITNKVIVNYKMEQPEMQDLFKSLSLTHIHNPERREFILTFPVTTALKGMNNIIEQLKLSGMFTGTEHQYYSKTCLD